MAKGILDENEAGRAASLEDDWFKSEIREEVISLGGLDVPKQAPETKIDAGPEKAAEKAPVSPAPAPAKRFRTPIPGEVRPTHQLMWQVMASEIEREAKAAGDNSAAVFLHEAGRVREEELLQPPDAAVLYQGAFNADPGFLPNLESARRLFIMSGSWEFAAQVLGFEASAVAPKERPMLIAGAALLKQHMLGDTAASSELAARALDEGGGLPVFTAISDVLYSTSTPERLRDVISGISPSVDDPATRMAIELTGARICEEVIGDEAGALDFYRKAWRSQPGDGVAFAGYARHLRKSGGHAELVELLKEQSSFEEGESGAYLRIEAAKVMKGRLEDPGAAAGHLLAAAAMAPGNEMILSGVADELEAAGRWDDLYPVLEKLIPTVGDRALLSAVHLRAGDLLADRLMRPADAIDHYSRALDLNPSCSPACAALGRLYSREGRHQELAELFGEEAWNTADPVYKVSKLFKMAEILEEKVKNDGEAIAAYRMVLELVPSHIPAMKALERMLGRLECYPELVELYEERLKITGDAEQGLFLLDKIGSILEEKLQDYDRAAAAYRRMLELSPGNLHAIHSLARVYGASRRWKDLLEITELEHQAAADPDEKLALRQRSGEILEEQLRDTPRAVAIFREILEAHPSYTPALRSLGRIYAREGRHADLVELYMREAGVTASQEQMLSLLYRAGRMQAEQLGDPAPAVDTFNRILSTDPTHLPSLIALEGIYTRTGNPAMLADVLMRKASLPATPIEKADTLYRAASVYSDTIGKPEQAVGILKECQSLVPGHRPAFMALERVYSACSMWNELAAHYRAFLDGNPGDKDRVRVLRSLAALAIRRLGDAGLAESCLREVLSISPGNADAHGMLDQILSGSGDAKGRAAHTEEWASEAAGGARLGLRLRLAALSEAAGDRGRASSHIVESLEMDPSGSLPLVWLEAHCRAAGDLEGVIGICRERLGSGTDPAARRDLRMKLAHMLALDGAPFTAVAQELEAAAGAPGSQDQYLPALLMLRDLHRKDGRWRDLLVVLDRIVSAAKDPQTVVAALVESGTVKDEIMGDHENATAIYMEAFGMDPGNQPLFERLEKNLTAKSDWERLVSVYDERAASIPDPAVRADLCMKAGKVYDGRLGRKEAALAKYREAAALQPSGIYVLEALAGMQEGVGHWQDAARTLEQMAGSTRDQAVSAAARRRLGVILHGKLSDDRRALDEFYKVLSVYPQDQVSLENLAEIQVARKDWTSAVESYRKLISSFEAAEKRSHYLMKLALVFRDGFGDRVQAPALMWKALELDPGNDEILGQVVSFYETGGNVQGLMDGLEAAIVAVPAKDRLPAVPLMLKKGDVLLNSMGDQPRAVAEYRRALEIAPKNIHAAEALSEIYGKSAETLRQAVDMHRRLLQVDPFRKRSWAEIARILGSMKADSAAHSALLAMSALGYAGPAEDEALSKLSAKLAAPGGVALGDLDRERYVVHPKCSGPVRRLMLAIGADLVKIYPPSISGFGARKGDRYGFKSKNPVRLLCDKVAESMSLKPDTFEVYTGEGLYSGASPETTEAPSIVVGGGVVRLAAAEQVFTVARALSLLKDRQAFLSRLTAQDLARIFYAAAGFAKAAIQIPPGMAGEVDETAAAMDRVLSKRSRKALEEMEPDFYGAGGIDAAAWLRGAECTATRTAFVVCGDVRAALACLRRRVEKDPGALTDPVATLGRIPDARDLLSYSISEDYLNLLKAVGEV